MINNLIIIKHILYDWLMKRQKKTTVANLYSSKTYTSVLGCEK